MNCPYLHFLNTIQTPIINYQLSIINYQLSIINYQLSIINYQLSIINYQLSIINYFSMCHEIPSVQHSANPIDRLDLHSIDR
jgi:hypothetical protein